MLGIETTPQKKKSDDSSAESETGELTTEPGSAGLSKAKVTEFVKNIPPLPLSPKQLIVVLVGGTLQ